MKRILLFALLITALPSFAQSQSVTLWLSSQQNKSGSRIDDVNSRFDDGYGYGLSYAKNVSRHLSAEFSLFRLSSAAALTEPGEPDLSLGDIEMTPIMAMLRYHFRPDAPLDVYAGAGAAYVMVDNLESDDLRSAGFASVDVNSQSGPVIGAGLTWSFTTRLGATLDARYMPFTVRASVGNIRGEDDLDPLIVSAGLRIRF